MPNNNPFSRNHKIEKPSFIFFVAIIAACMSLNAFSINIMLPAFGAIEKDLGVSANHMHQVITVFVAGNGIGQLFFGTLSDWLGRRRIILVGFIAYALVSFAAASTDSLHILLIMRFAQGLTTASSHVISRAIVRDLYSGNLMAKVMSSSFMIFIIVPTIAPLVGQGILLVATWRMLFISLAGLAILIAILVYFYLPETHEEEKRVSLDFASFYDGFKKVLTNPKTMAYNFAMSAMVGNLMCFISLTPQVFSEIFKKPELMALIFGLSSIGMGIAALFNSRLVMKFGSKRISNFANIAFVLVALSHLLYIIAGFENYISFGAFQTLQLATMSLSTPNFSSIAMEPMGEVAGMAASIQGLMTSLGGALFGSFISSFWASDIKLIPISAIVFGLIAFLAIHSQNMLSKKAS